MPQLLCQPVPDLYGLVPVRNREPLPEQFDLAQRFGLHLFGVLQILQLKNFVRPVEVGLRADCGLHRDRIRLKRQKFPHQGIQLRLRRFGKNVHGAFQKVKRSQHEDLRHGAVSFFLHSDKQILPQKGEPGKGPAFGAKQTGLIR